MSVAYLNRKSQKILIEVFRATSQNVQSSLVSTLLKPVDRKLHPAKPNKKKTPQTNIIKAGYLPVHQQRNAVLPARIGHKYQPLDENLYILAAIFKYRNSI